MSGRFTTLTNLSKQAGISVKFNYPLSRFIITYSFFGVVLFFLFLSASVCAGCFVVAGFVAGFVAAGFELVFVVVFVFVVVAVCFAGVVFAGDTELTELLDSFLVTSFF